MSARRPDSPAEGVVALLAAPPWLRGWTVENPDGLKDHYRMSSERISFDTTSLRTAAEGNDTTAAIFDDFGRACRDWIGEVEAEIMRCHGVVAAPVGSALRDFYAGLGDHAEGAGGDHVALGEALRGSATAYDDVDAGGAAAVNAAAGGEV